jgi:hypothetical protein
MGIRSNTGETDFANIDVGDRIKILDVSTGKMGETTVEEFIEDFHGVEIFGMRGTVEEFDDTARTLSTDDESKVLVATSDSAVTITVPATLPLGFNCAVAQWGEGAVTFEAGSGATNRSLTTATNAQYGMASLFVGKNTGSVAAEYILGGDVV